VLSQVRAASKDYADIHVLLLPPDARTTIKAIQRDADIAIEKLVKEGFGLTVTEGIRKGKPVIGGGTEAIRLQVVNHHTCLLVSNPEGAALRIRYLLKQPAKIAEMGRKAR
jgi:trehalose synthase